MPRGCDGTYVSRVHACPALPAADDPEREHVRRKVKMAMLLPTSFRRSARSGETQIDLQPCCRQLRAHNHPGSPHAPVMPVAAASLSVLL
jgi:hypothetical protein